MRSRFFFINLLALCLPESGLLAQADIGIIAGISNYQGDLASYSTKGGFKAKIGPVFGIHGGYEINDRFQFRADLLYTRLSGDDQLNDNEGTRERNLDFFSDIIQLAGGIDWNVFGFNQKDTKAFTPYVSAGVSIFHMSPKTIYEGNTVALHPLGTEGQYLDDYPDQKPYSLFQPSLQIGGGLKMITGKFIIALEAMASYTFTDYIDDVSTIYISYPELNQKAGRLAAALANRQGEYLNSEPVIVPTGSSRGSPGTKDYFGIIIVRVGIPIEIRSKYDNHWNSDKIKCPKF